MPVIQHNHRTDHGLSMFLGANPRPRDPAEDKYRYARLIAVPQYDLSQPYFTDMSLIPDITNQGKIGACTAFTAMEANYTLSRIDGSVGVFAHPGWWYEQDRKREGTWPQDAGAYEADNFDIALAQGLPLLSDAPYVDTAGQAYDQLTPSQDHNFIAQHLPFSLTDPNLIHLIIDGIVNNRPVTIAASWLSAWFNPSGGWLPDGINPATSAGGHEFRVRGYIPPRDGKPAGLVCPNHWTPGWSADAPSAGYGLRPGEFILPLSYLNPQLDVIWEFRAASAKAIQPQPEPEPTPQPTACKQSALAAATPVIQGLEAQLSRKPRSTAIQYQLKGAHAVTDALEALQA